MNPTRAIVDRRRANRFAIAGLRLLLAAVFVAIGSGFFVLPDGGAGQPHIGRWPTFGFLAGTTHLAVGIALLSSRAAAAAVALLLGPPVVWGTVQCLPPAGTALTGPILVTVALILLAICGWLWHRSDLAAWQAALDRCAHREMDRLATG